MANTVAAPVANNIGLAQKFLPILDDVYKAESKTAILDTASDRVEWIGAQTVKVYKTSLTGLAPYSRNAGYVPGSVTGTWETLTVEQDRARSFLIDALDDEQAVSMPLMSTLAEFERTMVIPELDAYRFAKISAAATGTNVVSAALTTGAADAIQSAIAVLDDKEVPEEGRILFISPAVYSVLKKDITRFTENGDPDVNGSVLMYDDMRVIKVPAARFNTAVTLNSATAASDAGGFTATGDAINFMIVHPSAVIQIEQHYAPRLFSPQQVYTADGWIYNFRIAHDVFVLDNKVNGVFVHKSA